MGEQHFIDWPHGITAIDTDYVRPQFDASHLIVSDGRAAFVDTGTSHSVPRLLEALDRAGLAREAVDYILLTHIHLDHAGGAGVLAKALPSAQVVMHPRGARHMADPAKLVAGSIAVYGEAAFAELYGDVVPIDPERIIETHDGFRLTLGRRPLEFIHTEGHARHHYCIIDTAANAVFTGDTFGVSYRELDTDQGPFIMPTSTPVHFDPDAAHASIDRIVALEPEAVFLTHYSRLTDIMPLAAHLHEGLDAYVDIALRHATTAARKDAIAADLSAWLDTRLDAHGFDADPARRQALLGMDVDLNAQGLDVWLTRREQHA